MRRLWFILFALLPVGYMLLYAPYGFCDTDQGFVPALAWRVAEGQSPYTDFIYVRPPLTLWLHAAEIVLLPENWEWIGGRAFFYVYIWLSVLFATLTVKKFFDFERLGLPLWLFASFAFVITAHNYPPMPWHTSDGVLFASIGFFLLTRGEHSLWMFAGLFAFGLSALCKQNFAFAAAGAAVYVLAVNGKRALFPGILAAVACGALLFITLGTEGVQLMLAQMRSASDMGELWLAGVMPYLYAGALTLPVIAAIVLVQKFPQLRKLAGWGFWLGFASMLSLYVLIAYKEQRSVFPQFYFTQVLFLLAVFVAVRGIIRKEQGYSLLLTMLVTAWAAGISWGYTTPIFFITPVLLGAMLLLHEVIGFRWPWFYWSSLTAVAVFAYFMLMQFPYRDRPRSEEYAPVAEVFPQVKMITAGKKSLDKWKNLKELVQKYGGEFAVLPSMPAAPYLFGRLPVFPVDWAHDAEADLPAHPEPFEKAIADKHPVIFIEKDKWGELEGGSKYSCSLGRWIALEGKWGYTRKEDTEWFAVFTQL